MIGRTESDEAEIWVRFKRSGGVLLVAGIVGGERRVDFVELLPLGGDLAFEGEGGAKALAIGRKTLGGVGGHALLFDEFHLEASEAIFEARDKPERGDIETIFNFH